MKKDGSWLSEHRVMVGILAVLAVVMVGSIFMALNLMKSPGGLARAGGDQSWMVRRPYSDDSPWNTPIGPNTTYDPHSEQMVRTLSREAGGAQIDQATYPVYFADSSTPRHNISCLETACSLADGDQVHRVDVLEGVPIPPGARPSSGKDAQMVIIDMVNGYEYGLLRAEWLPTGWQAGSGYRYDLTGDGTAEVLASRGAGIPYYAGLIRPWEVRAGAIEHALAFAYDDPAEGRCVYPASQTDGGNGDPYALPEGARLQLNPALADADFDRWNLSPAGKIVARALQKYGMFVVDRGGSPRLMAEDLFDNPLTSESWEARDLQYTADVVAAIPYEEFRVLALPRSFWDDRARASYFGQCLNYP